MSSIHISNIDLNSIMKVLLVTNKSNHHKYWVYKLYSKFDIVGICHPDSKPNRKILIRNLKKRGFIFSLLKFLSFFYHKFSKDSFTKKLSNYQNEFFSKAANLYEAIPQDIIYTVDNINSDTSIKKAKELNPDVICFLGGDIVKKEFLSVAKIVTLNYHSGVSPFYNGSGTTFSAVADSRPNFCGGTLMTMNERIDGGAILAHYLTPISETDDSSKLFLKGIRGAVKAYSLVLEHISKTASAPKGFTQGRSVKYCTSSEWTIYQDIKLSTFESSGKMKKYVRDEKIISFLDRENNLYFPHYLETLNEMLKK